MTVITQLIYGWIVKQTGLFNFVMTTDLGEGKL